MAKAITRAQAERISQLVKQVFDADQIIRAHRPSVTDESRARVVEAVKYSKSVRNTLHDEFGIIWHHENP